MWVVSARQKENVKFNKQFKFKKDALVYSRTLESGKFLVGHINESPVFWQDNT